MSYLAGIDIGGTKCAVSIGKTTEKDGIEICYKEKFPTPDTPEAAVQKMADTLAFMIDAQKEIDLKAIGISCGSPLDSKKGIIMCPPNLPNWDQIDVVTPFAKRFGVPVQVQNDANACGLAEWLWGAGRGTRNMIFLTFGTGLGAGLILDGKLYCGTCDMAGEVGHVRLSEDGPEGYGKKGSFEGFCSGGGIARFAVPYIEEWIRNGRQTQIVPPGKIPQEITTADIGTAAGKGDELALDILKKAGENLGKGLSVLIDILNPERIVIGSIYLRQEDILREPMMEVIRRETLLQNRQVCQVVPAGLGEQLGDYAALSVAGNLLRLDNSFI